MTARALGILLLLVGAAPEAPAAQVGHWLEAAPANAAETALRSALEKSAFGGPVATAESLRQVSAAYPGTTTSGLAQLAAGMLLLEGGKHAEAIPFLRHPDVARTALSDHALRALADALEGAGDHAGAGATGLAAVAARPESPQACGILFRVAEAFTKAADSDKALAALNRTLSACPDQTPRALLQSAALHEARIDLRSAAAAYDRIDADYPASPEAREAARRLRSLAGLLAPLAPEDRAAREMKKALALYEAGRYADGAAVLGTLAARKPTGDEGDLVHVRLGRSLLALGRLREAAAELGRVPAGSRYAAEAAFHLAKVESRRTRSVDGFEAVALQHAGTPWGEDALLALANNSQKDAKDDQALPYYRRMVEGHPDGRHADRATWHVAWADFRAGRFEAAAQALERAARLRPGTWSNAGFLYWAGRARRELGQSDRARQLLEETRQRFKYTYYGMRAGEALAQLPVVPATPPPVLRRGAADAGQDVPEPQLTRVRQLLLVDRLEEARDELLTVPPSTTSQATLAWIEWRRGRLRPAIVAMRRAFPEYAGEAGDQIPEPVWRILYPLDFSGLLQQKSAQRGLDPALVAAVVCQESTFNPGALSRAGARGLMQVIPKTGRTVARALRVRWSPQALYDPAVSLDFGTHYLREMLDQFGGRVERALAAYNAGPHRVVAWTAGRPDMGEEEFIESIPFTETRNYVMTILAGREQYRRLYGFATAATATAPVAAAGSHP